MKVLGIDVGGTKVALRAERDGAARDTVVAWGGDGDLGHDLAVLRDAVREADDAAPGGFDALGVALPATLDGGRVTSWPNRPHWVGLDWRGTLAGLVPGATARTADDGDLAALAEADRAGARDVVYLGVGTGVGGGIVLGGRLVPGPGRGSCEVGHMIVALDGPRCTCGRRGCLQALASGPAVLQRAGGLRGGAVRFEELRAAFACGERWARSAVSPCVAAVAAAAVSVTELVRSDLAVIGGGFAAGLPGFAEAVADRVGQLRRPGHPLPEIRPAALGAGSSLHGAVLLARRGELHPPGSGD